jgi:hypothetical protein
VNARIYGDHDPIWIFFVLLLTAALVVEVWAFVDAVRRPAGAFVAAGKQTRQIWLLISGLAMVLGFVFWWVGGITSFLAVAAFVAAAIYHVDVKPKVKEIRGGGGGTSHGPYGPW